MDAAAEIFEDKFKQILDRHAPIKIFQVRKNFTPFLSSETKLLMEERKVLKEEMTKNGDIVLAKDVNAKIKEIRTAIIKDEKEYYAKGLSDKVDITTAWKTANELLGNVKNQAPTAIKDTGDDGKPETITNPSNLASKFNNYFREKEKKLRQKTDKPPIIPPTQRLRK